MILHLERLVSVRSDLGSTTYKCVNLHKYNRVFILGNLLAFNVSNNS